MNPSWPGPLRPEKRRGRAARRARPRPRPRSARGLSGRPAPPRPAGGSAEFGARLAHPLAELLGVGPGGVLRHLQVGVGDLPGVGTAIGDLPRPLSVPLRWRIRQEKPAGTGARTPWHQDEAYWDPEWQYQNASIWMPLQVATVENGCMHYIPGTHKLGLVKHKAIKEAMNDLVIAKVDTTCNCTVVGGYATRILPGFGPRAATRQVIDLREMR